MNQRYLIRCKCELGHQRKTIALAKLLNEYADKEITFQELFGFTIHTFYNQLLRKLQHINGTSYGHPITIRVTDSCNHGISFLFTEYSSHRYMTDMAELHLLPIEEEL